jgi:hypothetical protein
LAAATFAEVSALKIVDFPTFGRPTIPHVNPIAWILEIERQALYLLPTEEHSFTKFRGNSNWHPMQVLYFTKLVMLLRY